MTVIRPNSISGITSITAQANEINIFRSDGTLAGLQINGVNFNNTSGISTLAALNVTGNVSIAGTLTYEDVTNVDSIGVITARTNIYLGDSIFHNGDANTRIRFPAADTISAETAGSERLRITSDGKIGINVTNPDSILETVSPATNGINAHIGGLYNDGGETAVRRIEFGVKNYRNAIQSQQGSGGSNFSSDNDLLLNPSGGNVSIGTNSPVAKLHVHNSGTGAADHAYAYFTTGDTGSDASSGLTIGVAANQVATVNYREAGTLAFGTNSTTRLQIDTNGNIGIGTNPTYGLDIMHDTGLMIRSSTNGVGAAISFTDASTNNWDQVGTIKYFHQNNVVENGIAEGFIIQGTESTTAVKIQGLLRVTAQPCASVYQCTGPSGNAITSDSQNDDPLHFDHVDINQGGMTISNNNARIQVPVDGIYFVSYMVSGTVNVVDVNDGLELVLRKNGGEYPAANSRAEPVFNFGADANAEEFFCNNTLLVQCSKDDYLEVSIANINNSDGTINRGNFMVMLMA